MEISKKFRLIITFLIGMLIFISAAWDSESKKFEVILDEYIDYYKINSSDHYILVNANSWTDSTAVIVISFADVKKDKLKLSKETLKGSYKGINIYLNNTLNVFHIPNGLHFERIKVIEAKEELYAYNEYFNDIQIIYHIRNNCILKLLDSNDNCSYFNKTFKKKGLICE